MNIKEFGGEFKLINAIVKSVPKENKEVIKGVGDDAAVISLEKNKYLLVSTDMFINGDHFDTKNFSPLEIGYKTTEATLSDIAAMGGNAKYIFVCISLRKNTSITFVRSVYRGIYKSCSKYGILVLGGDTTKSSKITISITALGMVSKKNLCFRSGAKVGDVVKVTGDLGGSSLGYHLFKRNFIGHQHIKKKHLEPKCRLDIVDEIAPYANAMTDISDGLASELGNICKESGVGVTIYKRKIPTKNYSYFASKVLGLDLYDQVLNGGEDFELVYTISKSKSDKTPGFEIGEITKDKSFYFYDEKNDKKTLITEGGFNHFN